MELRASDLSATPLPNPAEAGQAVVSHPEFGIRRLDITLEEAARIGELAMKDPVVVTVRVPEGEDGEPQEPHRYYLTPAAFGKLATRASAEVVMDEARSAIDTTPQRYVAPTGPKVDYTAEENYGLSHKGRVTEAEAILVRDNLERANANRARLGQAPIDPRDSSMIKRYGFGQPKLTEAAEEAAADGAPADSAESTEPQLTLASDKQES